MRKSMKLRNSSSWRCTILPRVINIVQLRYAVSFGIWGGNRYRGHTILNIQKP